MPWRVGRQRTERSAPMVKTIARYARYLLVALNTVAFGVRIN
jgi:hypothetical protein